MKKTFYIFCATVLGFLISIIVHALFERMIIKVLMAEHIYPATFRFLGGTCFLPPMISWSILFGFTSIGFATGFLWWQVVYVERRHWSFQCRNQKKTAKKRQVTRKKRDKLGVIHICG